MIRLVAVFLSIAFAVSSFADEVRLFTLPREKSWRYVDGAPVETYVEKASFAGTARPGEFYVFQLGFVPDKPIGPVNLVFGKLSGSSGGTIPSKTLRCISLGGIGTDGILFDKNLKVPAGQVQVLWCGFDVPADAKGVYTGRAVLRAGSRKVGEYAISINVTGEVLSDHGDSIAANLSRLRWLDSNIGSETNVTRPYVAMSLSGRTIKLLGRELTLSASGMPADIKSFFNESNTSIKENGRSVLADPVMFTVLLPDGPSDIRYKLAELDVDDVSADWLAKGKSGDFYVKTEGRMDYTGSGEIKIILKANRDIKISDIRLDIPLKEDAAKYCQGIGKAGGKRPEGGIQWKWDVQKRQDCLWIGDVNAGVMVRLKDESFKRPLVNIYYSFLPLVLPRSWGNEGQGGMNVGKTQDGKVVVSAFCGPRTMKSGEVLEFNYEFYLTPFRPIDTEKQWSVRFVHPHPSPSPAVIEGALNGMDAKAGPNVLNIHQAQYSAPYINYPYADDNFPVLKDIVRRSHEKGTKTRIYYTTRELTQNLKELYALHSMNGEVIFPGPGKAARTLIHKNGPHPWLVDNLGTNFIPAWVDHIKRPGAEWDLSVITTPDSRWNNFYLEGLKWMVTQADIDGIYIDDTALDARSLQRARRILDTRPGRLIDLHTWNHNNGWAGYANNMTLYMELLPYFDRLWIGEGFDASSADPDFWLVEMSGMPFGLMSEMLDGANPWKGLVFGETARMGWSGDPRSIWKAWDKYGIQGSEFMPYFCQKAVLTGNENIETVYKKKGRSLIAVANWGKQTESVTFRIDWNMLGLDSSKVSLYAPAIDGFQQERLWLPTEPIEIQPNRGWLIVVDEEIREVKQTKEPAVNLVQIFREGFTQPGIPDGWRVFKSTKAEMGVQSIANCLTIKGPANLYAGLERDLPAGTVAVEAEIEPGSDAGQTWGAGIALVWSDGKAAKMNVRMQDKVLGTFAGDGLRKDGGSVDVKNSVSVRILLDGDNVFFLKKVADKWVKVDTQSRAGRSGEPVRLRIGKMAEDGSSADFTGEAGKAGECMFRNVYIYGK